MILQNNSYFQSCYTCDNGTSFPRLGNISYLSGTAFRAILNQERICPGGCMHYIKRHAQMFLHLSIDDGTL